VRYQRGFQPWTFIAGFGTDDVNKMSRNFDDFLYCQYTIVGVFPQPNSNHRGVGVNSCHEQDLSTSFEEITLIDADCINPNASSLISDICSYRM
jgi:hypothetical protein